MALNKINTYINTNNIENSNGLAIFCGVIEDDLYFDVIKPKVRIPSTIYYCDDKFYTEPLEKLEIKESIGLLVIDNSSAGFGLINYNNFQVLESIDSGVSGKHKKGGQSQRRFERLRENELNEYYKRIAKYAKELLPFKIFIGGPAITKDRFIKGDYLDYRFNIIDIIDLNYSGSEGIRELIQKIYSNKMLEEYKSIQDKIVLQEALKFVPDGIFYTYEDVKNNMNKIKTVIYTEKIDIDKLKLKSKAEFILISSNIEEKINLDSLGGIIGVKN